MKKSVDKVTKLMYTKIVNKRIEENMKITREADYAIRILYIIKKNGGIISARDIS